MSVALKKGRGLGKGLEVLLGPDPAMQANRADAEGRSTEFPSTLPIDRLQTGKYQPRTRMDEGSLYQLAESIRSQGIMQPILVRPLRDADDGHGRYEIIAGERRYRAAKIAGLETVPVLIRPVEDEAAAIMALIENIQREDLNPIEEAQGLQRLVSDFGLTHEAAAQAVGRSRSAASNLLRLLQLAEPVQTMLMAGDLDMGHARSLLALPKTEQITTANVISGKRLSVRDAETLVKRLIKAKAQNALGPIKNKPTTTSSQNRDWARVEEELSDLLTTVVHIQLKKGAENSTSAQGAICLPFANLDELNALIEKLRGGNDGGI